MARSTWKVLADEADAVRRALANRRPDEPRGISEADAIAMRYPVRRRSTRRKRMGGLTWSLRSNPRPRKSRGCVTL